MPSECAHATCRNYVDKESQISFHRFPKDRDRCARWTHLMHRPKGWVPKSHHLVCSAHFKESDFDRTGQTIRLRYGVEPSIFDHQVSNPRDANNRRLRKRAASTSDIMDCQEPEKQQKQQVTPNFHTYAGSDDQFKMKWLMAEKRAEKLEKQLRNVTKREKRSQNSLRELMQAVRESNMLSNELQEKLNAFNDFPIHLFQCAGAGSYSDEQKKFALTLHRYGPKAYEFLRTKINLPCIRTLDR